MIFADGKQQKHNESTKSHATNIKITSTTRHKKHFSTEHTCLLSEVLPSHRNISCDFVTNQIYGLIMDNLNYEPKIIVRHIEQTYQYTISYLKHGRLNKGCSRCGSAHTRHHMITYLGCYPRLLLEILEAFMTHTSYQP